MKTLFLALGLVVMSAVSSMAGLHDSPYLYNVIDSQLSAENRICSQSSLGDEPAVMPFRLEEEVGMPIGGVRLSA